MVSLDLDGDDVRRHGVDGPRDLFRRRDGYQIHAAPQDGKRCLRGEGRSTRVIFAAADDKDSAVIAFLGFPFSWRELKDGFREVVHGIVYPAK